MALATTDDFVGSSVLGGRCLAETTRRAMVPFVKGGDFAPFYADVDLCVDWMDRRGHKVEAISVKLRRAHQRQARSVGRIRISTFRAGLLGHAALRVGVFRHAPARVHLQSISGHDGVLSTEDHLSVGCAAAQLRRHFELLVAISQMAVSESQYEVGSLTAVPVPSLDERDRAHLASACASCVVVEAQP